MDSITKGCIEQQVDILRTEVLEDFNSEIHSYRTVLGPKRSEPVVTMLTDLKERTLVHIEAMVGEIEAADEVMREEQA